MLALVASGFGPPHRARRAPSAPGARGIGAGPGRWGFPSFSPSVFSWPAWQVWQVVPESTSLLPGCEALVTNSHEAWPGENTGPVGSGIFDQAPGKEKRPAALMTGGACAPAGARVGARGHPA